jgi:peptidoglycan hydrolase-like protein with peptidoglycan-binding domain
MAPLHSYTPAMDWARAPRPAARQSRPRPVGMDQGSAAPNPLLDLQRSAGNAAVSRLVDERRGVVQRQAPAAEAGSAARPVLKLGDSGPAVTEVQRALISLGYPVTVDGSYGARTAGFVCLMQLGLHLSVDGQVGPETWEEVDIFNSLDRPDSANPERTVADAGAPPAPTAALGAPIAGSSLPVQRAGGPAGPEAVSVEDLPKAAPPQLQRGDNGTDVRKLQQALAFLYADAGVRVDGEFGAETAAFVLLFQVQNGLAADAVVGPATHKALDPLASAARKIAAIQEIGAFSQDLAAMRPEDRERLTKSRTLPSGIAADLEELASEQ